MDVIKNSINTILVMSIILLASCTHNKNDYFIKYSHNNINKNDIQLIKAIFFESSFNNDFIEIKVNDETIFRDTITTSNMGLAKYIPLNNYMIKKLCISINKNNFMIKKGCCKYLFINKSKDTIYINYDDKVYGYR